METSSRFVGSKKLIAGLNLLAYYICYKTEGYGFIEFEMSNSTISTVFRQPLNIGKQVAPGTARGPASRRVKKAGTRGANKANLGFGITCPKQLV